VTNLTSDNVDPKRGSFEQQKVLSSVNAEDRVTSGFGHCQFSPRLSRDLGGTWEGTALVRLTFSSGLSDFWTVARPAIALNLQKAPGFYLPTISIMWISQEIAIQSSQSSRTTNQKLRGVRTGLMG